MRRQPFSLVVARQRLLDQAPGMVPTLLWVENRLPKCESDLECWFLVSFVYGWHRVPIFSYAGEFPPASEPLTDQRYFVNIEQQVPVAGYRCDFMFTFQSRVDDASVRIAVECDGHSFHERTREQASHDRRRDRKLLAEGIPTLRYTYSDLVGEPEASMKDLRLTLMALAKNIRGAE